MLTDLQRDILIKSREGIQEGLWCTGAWFIEKVEEGFPVADSRAPSLDDADFFSRYDFKGHSILEEVALYHRCAEGEVAFRTIQAGGTIRDYQVILREVQVVLEEGHGEEDACESVAVHNDLCMNRMDKMAGGQEWARIFDVVINKSL